MSMEYIRKFYGVPAKRGGRVIYTRPVNSGDAVLSEHSEKIGGTIKSAVGHRLNILLDGDEQPMPLTQSSLERNEL